MAFFRKKKGDFVDLREKFGAQRRNSFGPVSDSGISNLNVSSSSNPDSNKSSSDSQNLGGMFGIFGSADVSSTVSANSNSNPSSGYADFTSSVSNNSNAEADEKRKRLTKRILDMTEKIEDLSNQIYKMQQRIEVLERKAGVGGMY